MIEQQIEAHITLLKVKVIAHSVVEVKNLCASILDLLELHRIAAKYGSVEDEKRIVFIIPSLFLRDCLDYLRQQEEESLHFVTGVHIDNIVILDRLVKLEFEKQTVVFAKADSTSVKNALLELTRNGYRLFAYFHIHPGTGEPATHPSSIDKKLDELLQRGKYQAVGAIFSRDGYARFFTDGNYEVQIYGRGVQQIDDRTFKVVEPAKT
ncbi:hypothetical protein HZA73_09590 [candidate division TA06 bacterium]|nr:hypothetical protein [candidate division TA06 bacterium]